MINTSSYVKCNQHWKSRKHSFNSKGNLQSYLTCGCVIISLVVLVANWEHSGSCYQGWPDKAGARPPPLLCA